MFIETKKVTIQYSRKSKLGIEHSYSRIKTVVVFNCDNCNLSFNRELGKMDHRRLSNEYLHVCPECNQKQFAQKQGVERRALWNLPVDSDRKI